LGSVRFKGVLRTDGVIAKAASRGKRGVTLRASFVTFGLEPRLWGHVESQET